MVYIVNKVGEKSGRAHCRLAGNVSGRVILRLRLLLLPATDDWLAK